MKIPHFERLWIHKEQIIFYSLILFFLFPLFNFKYFPSQDGPAHAYNSSLILSFHDSSHSIFPEYLKINTKFDPTWFGHIVLAILMLVFPAIIAEKILVGIYVILLPISARYALGGIKTESKCMAVLFFPFVYNYLLHMGFYSFSLSLSIGLFVFGYWIRYYEDLRIKRIVVLSILTTLLYFNHVVSLGVVTLAIGTTLIGSSVIEIFNQGSKGRDLIEKIKHFFCHNLFRTFIAFLPSILIAAFFLLSRETESQSGNDFYVRLYNLIHMMPMVSYSWKELWIESFYLFSIFGASFFFLFKKLEKNKIDRTDSLLLASFVCFVFYLIVPEPVMVSENGLSGGGFMDMRVSYYVFFMAFLWFGSQAFSKVMKNVVHFAAVVVSVFLIFTNVSAYNKINLYIDEYLSVSNYIEPNTTLLSLDSCGGEWEMSYKNRVKPFLHVSNYVAEISGAMAFRNYEAGIGYFPFVFRPEKNPYLHIGLLECETEPPPANFIDYFDRTGGTVDYVSMWLGKRTQQNDKNLIMIYKQLEDGYDLIYESPNGLVELYGNKDIKRRSVN